MDTDVLEEIRKLKHAYFRLLDTKHFQELGELFTEEATTAYESGKLSQVGRAAIVAFLEESLTDPGIVTMHHGHHPEITLDGPDRARGTWYLEDRVIVPAFDLVISGTALYSDQYRLEAGGWRIAHTGYERIFEEHRTYTTGAAVSFTSRFGALRIEPPA